LKLFKYSYLNFYMTELSEFHLWDNLRFQSWGILTSFKFEEKEIVERQKRVIWILEKYSGVQIVETRNWPWVDTSQVWNHSIPRIIRLLEESSIIQDALHYLSTSMTAQWKSIWDIVTTIALLKVEMMTNQSEKVNIYNFIDINIWEIISDLKNDIQRWAFQPNENEKQDIKDVISAREEFLRFFNSAGGSIMIWGR